MDKAWIPNFVEQQLKDALAFQVCAFGRAGGSSAAALLLHSLLERRPACRTPHSLPMALPPCTILRQVGVEKAMLKGRLRLTLRPLLKRVPVVGAVQARRAVNRDARAQLASPTAAGSH